MIKAQLRNFKKNRIMVCFSLLLSVIISLSAPFSINSNAESLSLGVSNVDFASSLFTFLATFDVFSSIFEDPLADPYSDTSIRKQITDLDIQNSYPLFADMNQYESGLGDDVKSAVIASCLGGSWVIPQSLVSRVRAYLQNEATVNSGVLIVGSKSTNLPLNSAGYVSRITVNYHLKSNSANTYSDVITFTSSNEYLSFFIPSTSSNQSDLYEFSPAFNGTMTYTIERGTTWNNPSNVASNSATLTNSSGDSFVTNIGSYYFNKYYYEIDGISVQTQAPTSQLTYNSLGDVLWNLKQTGIASADINITATIGDVEQDIVSDGSSIESDGSVVGNLIIPVSSMDKLQAIINNIQSGILSVDDAVKLLGVARVNSDATQSEKQDAISDLISTYPYIDSADYGSISISESTSKVNTFTHIEHSIANAIAQIMGRELPYPDEPQDVGPNGQPYIEDWNFPSLDPSDPDPGGSEEESEEDSNRAGDVAAAIPVVAGLASDIFDSASGFNLVTTIGYSFVIFSAILGASHFFGALGGRHDDVKHPLDWNRSSERWSSKRTDFKSDW